jgi:hypothetical protein
VEAAAVGTKLITAANRPPKAALRRARVPVRAVGSALTPEPVRVRPAVRAVRVMALLPQRLPPPEREPERERERERERRRLRRI